MLSLGFCREKGSAVTFPRDRQVKACKQIHVPPQISNVSSLRRDSNSNLLRRGNRFTRLTTRPPVSRNHRRNQRLHRCKPSNYSLTTTHGGLCVTGSCSLKNHSPHAAGNHREYCSFQPKPILHTPNETTSETTRCPLCHWSMLLERSFSLRLR